MPIIFFSANQDIIQEFKQRHSVTNSILAYDMSSLEAAINQDEDAIVICDYDSIAHDLNRLIASNNIPKNCAVLERSPAISTGKSLISHGIKAYGNTRMLSVHYFQMLQTLQDKNIWTYPELTAALIKSNQALNQDAQKLIEARLTDKEQEVVLLVLDGLTNQAISQKLNITLRTVKAHVSSIFTKLHVNDRVSLVLLLK